MIKVNLKNTKTAISRFGYSEPGTDAATGTQLSTVLSQFRRIDLSEMDAGFLARLLFKIVFLLTLPFCLKVYEVINITRLENTKKKTESELASKKDRVNQAQAQIDAYKYLSKKEEEFHKKRKLISGLASSRLVIPRFLDELQTGIPLSVWLKKVTVDPKRFNSKKEEIRRVSFSGESLNEEIINNFVEELRDIVDANSIQMSTRDIKEKEISVRVRFDITAEIRDEI